METQGTCW